MRARLSFRHGVHPPEHKELTAGVPVRRMPYPDEIVLPLRQHTGKPARPLVEPGDRVERGDKIGEADGFVSVPIHASSAGTVKEIGLWPHPDGSMAEAIRITVDTFSPQIPRPRIIPHWDGLTPDQVVKAVQRAGVVGLGGAAFPTHVKLLPPDDVAVDTLIVNGAECEPYLTTDHRVMTEYPERVQFGIRIMMHTLGVERAIIGVEKNKPDAIEALRRNAPGRPGRDRAGAHGEVSAGLREDADPRPDRPGCAPGQAADAHRSGRPERRFARLHRGGVRDGPPPHRAGRHGHRPRPPRSPPT